MARTPSPARETRALPRHLAVAVGEEAGTLEEVNEPYLIMEGYIKRTTQGRVALPNAYRKLGLKLPVGAQSELFGQ